MGYELPGLENAFLLDSQRLLDSEWYHLALEQFELTRRLAVFDHILSVVDHKLPDSEMQRLALRWFHLLRTLDGQDHVLSRIDHKCPGVDCTCPEMG